MPEELFRIPTEADSLRAITELLKSGAFKKSDDRRQAAQILEALQGQTQYLTDSQKDELSASVDDTLTGSGYPAPSTFWALWPNRPYFDAYHSIIDKAISPPVFHFFAAATVLGAATGLRVWYPTEPDALYPNMSVCFVGPTGRVTKTTATKPALYLLELLNEEKEHVYIIYNKANPRSLINILSQRENADCLIYAPEFSAFISKDRASDNFAPTLADLLDTHKRRGDLTIAHAQQMLKNTCLSILAASNLDWLVKSTPADMMTGGLMNRIVFVVQETRYRRSTLKEWMTPPESKITVAALEHLQWASSLEPQQASLSPEAHEAYDHWNLSIKDNIDPMMASYVERKHVHVLRLALILALADKRTKVKRIDVEESIAIMGWVETFIPLMLEQMQGETMDHSQNYVIRKMSQSVVNDPETGQRTITKGKLVRDSHWKLAKVNRVLRDLVAAGMIRKCSQFPERYALVRLEK